MMIKQSMELFITFFSSVFHELLHLTSLKAKGSINPQTSSSPLTVLLVLLFPSFSLSQIRSKSKKEAAPSCPPPRTIEIFYSFQEWRNKISHILQIFQFICYMLSISRSDYFNSDPILEIGNKATNFYKKKNFV